MHSLVRRFIKTGVAFLAVGLALGGYLMVHRELFGAFPHAYLVSAHTHAILVGFVMSMILGVALWLFPRPEKTDVQYRPGRAAASYWLLTIGTSGRIIGEVVRPVSDAAWLRWGVVTCGFLQIAAVLTFFYTMWPRIRGVGSPLREAKGERF